jgi:rfaE bifunctional protein kinase chain/domain
MNARIVVVGDTLLDVDLSGASTRLSPDGPVPVVDVSDRRERAGGAGLVAALLATDGVRPTLATALSGDAGAARIRAALSGVHLVAAALEGPTPTKTRLHANGHPVARIDEGCGAVAPVRRAASVVEAIGAADIVIAADYGRGLLANAEVRAALGVRAREIPVVWDPHPRGAEPVDGCRIVTPNRSEAAGLCGRALTSPEDAIRAADQLRRRWAAACVVVTLDADGAAAALEDGGSVRLPAQQVTVADACGAGDRFSSAVALALARRESVVGALAEAVAACSAFLAAGGVAALAPDAASPSRIRSLQAVS